MYIIEFIKSIQERDEAKPSFLEVVLAYPGFHSVILFHPLAHMLHKLKLKALARVCSYISRVLTGIEIHPGAKLGKFLFIDHGTGVVIGETVIIGNYCRLYHCVTLGGRGGHVDGRRHPLLADHVTIGAGSQVIGPITLGDHATVGANSLVTKDIPAGMAAIGNPARLVGKTTSDNPSYGIPETMVAEND
jgi:serine O-acetyltransferase